MPRRHNEYMYIYILTEKVSAIKGKEVSMFVKDLARAEARYGLRLSVSASKPNRRGFLFWFGPTEDILD